jgi:hypothetical protein
MRDEIEGSRWKGKALFGEEGESGTQRQSDGLRVTVRLSLWPLHIALPYPISSRVPYLDSDVKVC